MDADVRPHHSRFTPIASTGNAFVAVVVIRKPAPWNSHGAFVRTSIRSVAPTTSPMTTRYPLARRHYSARRFPLAFLPPNGYPFGVGFA